MTGSVSPNVDGSALLYVCESFNNWNKSTIPKLIKLCDTEKTETLNRQKTEEKKSEETKYEETKYEETKSEETKI